MLWVSCLFDPFRLSSYNLANKGCDELDANAREQNGRRRADLRQIDLNAYNVKPRRRSLISCGVLVCPDMAKLLLKQILVLIFQVSSTASLCKIK